MRKRRARCVAEETFTPILKYCCPRHLLYLMSTVRCRAKHANTAWTGFIKVSEENAIIRDSVFCIPPCADRKVIVVIVDDKVEEGASFLPSQCLLSVLVEADLGDHHSAPPHGEYRPPQAQQTPHCDWTHCVCVR